MGLVIGEEEEVSSNGGRGSGTTTRGGRGSKTVSFSSLEYYKFFKFFCFFRPNIYFLPLFSLMTWC